MRRFRRIAISLILWSISLIALQYLPSWISNNASWNAIIWVTVNILFALMFIIYGIGISE